jgi:hypothetical protein
MGLDEVWMLDQPGNHADSTRPTKERQVALSLHYEQVMFSGE